MSSTPTVYYGAVINPVNLTEYQALPRCLLAVGSDGTIDWIVNDVESSMVQETMARNGYIDTEIYELKDGEFLMPGLIDTHTASSFSFFILI
jgi:guanine deaminase